MTSFIEGELRVTFTDAVSARKFDGDDHGLSHCMKAVDFVIELANRYIFIEFKDAQASKAPKQDMADYLNRFLKGQVDEELKSKYRDSFIYEWAAGRADKPISYFVLFASDSLDAAQLLSRQDELKRILPLTGPRGQSWIRPFVTSCAVFNIAMWNKNLRQYPVIRISC